jgi:HPt (histidine-containing phosphotransfer) domain-containing protein
MVVNMNRQDCINAGINYDDGVARFVGNAGMYEKFLRSFLQDDSFAQLREAMGRGDVGASFQAAHTLKGLTGNLSLERLYKKLVVLTDALRGEGDMPLAKSLFPDVEKEYADVTAFIASQG